MIAPVGGESGGDYHLLELVLLVWRMAGRGDYRFFWKRRAQETASLKQKSLSGPPAQQVQESCGELDVVATVRMSYIREKAIAGLKRGDCFAVSRTFTEQDTLAFAEISRDYNPVHFDDRFARVKNLDGRICHGLLVVSILTEIGGQIGWLASGMNFRFKKPVYFGDTIECRFTITELDERNRAKAEAVFKNQRDEIVIEAHVTGIIPGSPEKRAMEAMVAEGDSTNKCR
jgi:acyl dehydratase